MNIENVHFGLIRQWATDRNIILGSPPPSQYVKLMEEYGEFTLGLGSGNFDEVKDGLGDTVVVLTILAAQLGTTIEDCIKYSVENDIEVNVLHSEDDLSATIRLTINFFSNLATGISKKNKSLVIQGIGHAYQTLYASANYLGLALEDCIEEAYNSIKDRKGRMINGVFIKEADLAAMDITE